MQEPLIKSKLKTMEEIIEEYRIKYKKENPFDSTKITKEEYEKQLNEYVTKKYWEELAMWQDKAL